MFIREAKLVADLVHENIVQVYQLGKADDVYYIAMEYAEGPNLAQYITRHILEKIDLPIELGAFITSRVCRGLEYAHKKRGPDKTPLGIVHRDISPKNIMVTYEGVVKITDFGIARLTDSAHTRTGVVLGTPSFMSPEQLQGREVTGQSDLFSLAVTLYQLLTAQLPFRADSMPELMLKIVQDPHPRIRAIRPDLPEKLDAFFERALGKDPADRFESGAAFSASLRQIGGTLRD